MHLTHAQSVVDVWSPSLYELQTDSERCERNSAGTQTLQLHVKNVIRPSAVRPTSL